MTDAQAGSTADAYAAGRAALIDRAPFPEGPALWLIAWAVAQADAAAVPPVHAALPPADRMAAALIHAALTDAPSDPDEPVGADPDTALALATLRRLAGGGAPTRADLARPRPRGDQALVDPLAAALHVVRACRAHETALAEGRFDPILGPLADPAVQSWLRRWPDPALWHRLPSELDWDAEAVPETFLWIVGQPLCDRATAAALFLKLGGADAVGLPRAALPRGDLAWSLVAAILERSESGRPWPSRYTLSWHGLDDDQRPQLAALRARRQLPGGLPLPEGLLGEPFAGEAPDSATQVEGGGWISRRG